LEGDLGTQLDTLEDSLKLAIFLDEKMYIARVLADASYCCNKGGDLPAALKILKAALYLGELSDDLYGSKINWRNYRELYEKQNPGSQPFQKSLLVQEEVIVEGKDAYKTFRGNLDKNLKKKAELLDWLPENEREDLIRFLYSFKPTGFTLNHFRSLMLGMYYTWEDVLGELLKRKWIRKRNNEDQFDIMLKFGPDQDSSLFKYLT